MGKFKKGFLFGGLLGAGIMWMSTTKKGREVRVGRCEITFHCTPKSMIKERAARRKAREQQ